MIVNSIIIGCINPICNEFYLLLIMKAMILCAFEPRQLYLARGGLQ